ncbi:hypothetical protein GCM10009661_38350 [Catellatospora chokoriensis]|uniref:Uncharacterized protein n=1 Tax=Catellatospora chokoriensis TaxID=310353 RepID=A0A8J3K989_9ACTN|nr:hypothetical protein Cch02nite_43080 [Catellatospora chokoriensis]
MRAASLRVVAEDAAAGGDVMHNTLPERLLRFSATVGKQAEQVLRFTPDRRHCRGP